MFDDDWKPYIRAEDRRRQAARDLAKLKRERRDVAPVIINGQQIARTFWGKAWCENLQRYSDYANRLPRGRSYVRQGSVVDLQIHPRIVTAMVSGSDLYEVEVKIAPIPSKRWNEVCADCAGQIDSLVELLEGRLSGAVMARICQERKGLFPSPSEITLSCSCPDSASMCKHIAAVLYGIGARLDDRPELLFLLRNVNQNDLITGASRGMTVKSKASSAERILQTGNLSELFGIEIVESRPRQKRKRRRNA